LSEKFTWIGPILIDETKIRDYLLSMDHPEGVAKFRFFLRLGFHPRSWRRLEQALRSQLRSGDLAEVEDMEYGRKVVIVGSIEGLNGLRSTLRTVWIQRREEKVLRFVTAYPSQKTGRTK